MPVSEYTPGIDDIGQILRARTFSRGGQEIGTFTEETRPTDTQVAGIIEKAAGNVSLAIGADISAALFEDAQTVVCYMAAMIIELSFYPEQVSAGRSAYEEYKTLYEEAIGTKEDPGWLVLAVQDAAEGGVVDPSTVGKPSGEFPAPMEWVW